MTEVISKNLPALDYHAMRRFSASFAWTAVDDCPAKALWRSPWNAEWEPEEKAEFDLGSAAHLAVLEPARRRAASVVIDAANYRTARAQEARDAARAAGIVPLLPWQDKIVSAIAGSIQGHPMAADAFADGDPEVTITWSDAGTGVPCKARIDWLPRHRRWLVDLKTAVSANPRKWRDQAYRLGYHARAAWYLDGAEAMFRRRPVEYWFVVVEKEPPYLVSVIALDEAAIEFGRMVNRRALDLINRGDWHGYREPGANRDRAFRVSLPPWGLFQMQDRAEAGEFGPVNDNRRNNTPDPTVLRIAERMFSPNPEV